MRENGGLPPSSMWAVNTLSLKGREQALLFILYTFCGRVILCHGTSQERALSSYCGTLREWASLDH